MRSFLRRSAVAVIALLVLTGCGDSTATPEAPLLSTAALASASTAGTAPDSSETPAGTRVVKDVWGVEITVPTSPQRVVTLSEPTLDGVLALGVVPIGATAGRGQSTVPDYLPDEADAIEILGSVAQPNLEAIAAVAPDLILVDGTSINNNPPLIATLQEIAPTVETGLAGGDWKVNFRLVADAVGLAADGEQVIAAYDATATALSVELDPFRDQTFSIVRWQGNGASLILRELPGGRALTDLGLQRPQTQDRDGRGHSEPVAQERLADIDADWIFFGSLGGSSVGNPQAGGAADSSAGRQALDEAAASTPGFTTLTAYQAGQIVPVDGAVWTSTGGPLLMNRLLTDIRAALLP